MDSDWTLTTTEQQNNTTPPERTGVLPVDRSASLSSSDFVDSWLKRCTDFAVVQADVERLFGEPATQSTEDLTGFAEVQANVDRMFGDPTAWPVKDRNHRADKSERAESRENGSKSNADLEGAFNQFWQAYPRKRDKQEARKAFAKIPNVVDMLPVLLRAVEAQKETEEWQEESKFIPYPSKWLNTRRWEDDVTDDDTCQPSADEGAGGPEFPDGDAYDDRRNAVFERIFKEADGWTYPQLREGYMTATAERKKLLDDAGSKPGHDWHTILCKRAWDGDLEATEKLEREWELTEVKHAYQELMCDRFRKEYTQDCQTGLI